jgi:predicted metal-dependent phosphoesterase TrpH
LPTIDLHTHTQPLSHDSALSPDNLIDAARREGLQGVCLTEHDFFWDLDEVAALSRRHEFLVLPGVEVNTEWGHILVFGLTRFVYGMHRFTELATMVSEAGGAMVAAHPYRRQLPFELRNDGDWSESLERAAQNPAYRLVQAVETVNGRGSDRQNEFSAALGDWVGLPSVGGSDAHALLDVGRCATEFQASIGGLEDLISELNAGRCRPLQLRDA